jgi:type IV pilus assembly protein PilW
MNRSRGFSLVELMIAVTLALLVTGGVLSVFVGSRSAFQSTSGTAALTDSGRFAFNFIQQSVRGAGYMACNTANRQISMLNNVATPIYYSFTQALGGYEANNTGVAGVYNVTAAPVVGDGTVADWALGLDAALSGLVVKNNDVFVVRSTLPGTQTAYVTAIVDGASNFTVNNSSGLQNNQLAVISDCAKSAVFQVRGVAPVGANSVISHNAGGFPGNNVSPFPVSFSVGSQVTAVNTIAYYIGVGADGDGALFAQTLNATSAFTAQELVSDVEAMQVLYGVDTTGTQTVSQYVTADLVADFNTVMSVKIALLTASPPGAVTRPAAAPTYSLLGTIVTVPQDTRARQIFEMSIAVRNSIT